MANELTINASMSFAKTGVTFAGNTVGASFTNLLFNVTGNNYVANTVLVVTGGQQLDLAAVATPHYGLFQNQDSTNYITMYNGVSGAVFARLLPQDIALVPLDPTIALYAKANTASCYLSYLIISS